jgi:hypothetical protein
MSRIDHLVAQLEAIGEELDELAFDRLREASAEGVRERPEWDRRLVQARRAVEKAAAALRQVDGG